MDSCRKMLGKRIKELRKSKNLTQEKLSELVGFEPNHITKIEAGKHFPQPEKLEILAKYSMCRSKICSTMNIKSQNKH